MSDSDHIALQWLNDVAWIGRDVKGSGRGLCQRFTVIYILAQHRQGGSQGRIVLRSEFWLGISTFLFRCVTLFSNFTKRNKVRRYSNQHPVFANYYTLHSTMYFETNLILHLLGMRRNTVLKRLQKYLGIALAPETPAAVVILQFEPHLFAKCWFIEASREEEFFGEFTLGCGKKQRMSDKQTT